MKKILFAALMLISFSAADCQAQGFGKFMKSAAKELGKVLTTPTTDSSSSDTGSSAAPAASGTSFSSQSMGEQTLKISRLHPDLEIKVTRCQAVDNVVFLTITLKSTNADIDPRVDIAPYHGKSKCIDDTGKEIHGNSIEIMASGDREYSSESIFTLVQDVKKKIDFKITGVSKSAESIARFDSWIRCQELGIDDQYITLKNVPISRDEE